MDTTEVIFSLAIAILYPFFFNKLTKQIVGYDKINEMCDKYNKYSDFFVLNSWSTFDRHSEKKKEPTPEDIQAEKCRNERKELLDKAELHSHLFMIFVSLVGIFATSFVSTNSTKLGLGLGGVFSLIFTISMTWYKYGEMMKLIVLGLSLLFVLFFSVRLYNINSIANIFSFEFGTK